MTRCWGRLLVSATGLLLSLGSVSNAVAAELEEITVTAERRQSNLQKVPIAVTAFTADEIDRRQITSTIDVIQNVPNLTGEHNVSLGGSNSYSLRGIGNTESIATFDIPIGTYVDEIYLSRQNQNQIRLFHTESLEVLRGPQGTLFGRNTTGGAIVVVSEKPGEEFSTRIEGGVGSYERYFLRAAVDAPVSDTFLTQFNAFVIDEDGWLDSATTGETYNGEEAWGLRGAFRFIPSDALTWDLSVQYTDTENQMLGVAAALGTQTPIPPRDLTHSGLALGSCSDANTAATGDPTAVPVCSFNEMEALLVASNIGWDAGPVMINFITGWYDLEQNFSADFLDTSGALFGGAFDTFLIANDGSHEQFSQEIKLSGAFANDRVNYVAGLFYMDEDNTTVFTDWLGIYPGLFPAAARTPMANGTESFAVYGQFNIGLTDKATLQLGGRWTDEDKDFSMNGNFGGVLVTDADLVAAGIPLEQSVSKFTPRVAFNYQFMEDLMGYASWTSGFKSGGWNARATSAAELTAFGEEEVDSYELGMRSEWLDRRLRINVTGFFVEYTDLQIAAVLPGTNIFGTNNAGDSEVKGLEVEGSWNATENLNIYGNLGLMDNEYTRLTQEAIDTGLGPDIDRTPDASALLGFNYTVAPTVLGGGIYFGGQLSWTDDYFIGSDNEPVADLIEEHTLVNLHVGWISDSDRWEVIVECKNCFDEEWIGNNFVSTIYPSDPVRWGIRLKYRSN